jgi:VWFA-related protein
MIARLAALLAIALVPASAANRILVTVTGQKTGAPVTGLKASDFAVFDDKTPRKVEASEYVRETLDIMMLVDTSLAGGMVQPAVQNFIEQLQPKEQMALVAFHSSADLIQDFTSSRELLLRAFSQVKYGNEPHVLDALYAAMDGGFEHTTFRRVILLLTAGVEGASRTGEREVVRLARRKQVSIYPVYVMGRERSLFELLAKQSGGAVFHLRDRKGGGEQPGARVFDIVRGHYIVTVAGNLGFGDRLKVEVKSSEKLFIAALPLE